MSRFVLSRRLSAVVLVAVVGSTTPVASAQSCGPQWLSTQFSQDLESVGLGIAVSAWDRDGSGPQTPVLAAAGFFERAGSFAGRNIAVFDPSTSTWSQLSAGANNFVTSLLPLADGRLVAAGGFTQIGGVSASRIGIWGGSSWSALSSASINGAIFNVAQAPSGTYYVTGEFTSISSIGTANRIAAFNGTSWSTLTTGLNGDGLAVLALPSGDIIVGGDFSLAGSVNVERIARFRPSTNTWFALGGGVGGVNASVNALGLLPNGDILVGGRFTSVGGGVVSVSNLARWNGTNWSTAVSGGPSGVTSFSGDALVTRIRVLSNGDAIITGRFDTAGTAQARNVARWNAATSSMSALGTTNPNGVDGQASDAAQLPSGLLVVTGQFREAGSGVPAKSIASFISGSWSETGTGLKGVTDIRAAAALPSGDLVLAGIFDYAGSFSRRNNIARWNGVDWLPLGSGTGGVLTAVNALLALPSGNVIAGGNFVLAGGLTTNGVAQWNGTTWSGLGSGLAAVLAGDQIEALARTATGDIIAGGRFSQIGGVAASNIARWNGTSWAPLGTGTNGSVSAIRVLASGDIVAGGTFTLAGGTPANRIARWDGVAWSAIGTGLNGGVNALAQLTSGEIVAGGRFTAPGSGGGTLNRIAQWNGTAWAPLGTGMTGAALPDISVNALFVEPSGTLVAAGAFDTAGGTTASRVARWNGTSWSPLGAGVFQGTFPAAQTIARLPSGELIVGGTFEAAGTLLALGWGRWVESAAPFIQIQPVSPPAVNVGAQTNLISVALRRGYPFNFGTLRWELETAPGSDVYIAQATGAVPGSAATATVNAFSFFTSSSAIRFGNADAGLNGRRVRYSIESVCGGLTSVPALITVNVPSCYANCDGSTTQPVLNALDFACFLQRYTAGEPYANCDASTTQPLLNALDFACFLQRYTAGCP